MNQSSSIPDVLAVVASASIDARRSFTSEGFNEAQDALVACVASMQGRSQLVDMLSGSIENAKVTRVQGRTI